MKKLRFIAVSLVLLTLSACGGDDGGSNNGGNGGGGWQEDGGAWGTMVEIPDGNTGVHLTMRTSNEGVYMTTLDANADIQSVYRLQMGGPSPDWNHWDFSDDSVVSFFPAKANTENPDEFAIHYSGVYKFGFISMNSDVPAELLSDIPYEVGQWNAAQYVVVDNSSQAYTWAFWGSEVRVNSGNGQFETIADLPTNGINFVQPDPDDAVMWVASGTSLFRLTVNGDYTEFDVSDYTNPDMFIDSIEKVRFSGNDVYFRAQNNVFKLANGNTLSLFYQIDNGANFMGGDFAVDNTYMYATDGIRKKLSGGNETNIIPEMPTTSDQQVLMDYFTNTTAYQTGQLEVSTNATSGYIYCLANDKVLIVPKNP